MGIWNRLTRSILGRNRLNDDLSDEMAFHIEERTRDNVAAGMTEAAARRDALARFGNAARLRDETRDVDVVDWLDAMVRESALALRGLRRRPGLTATALLTLALGLGAATAIFSVIDAVLLRPLPVPDAGRVVALQDRRGVETFSANPARLLDWRNQARSVELVSAYYSEGRTLTGHGAPERFDMLRSFGPLVELYGLRPALGRAFTRDEEAGTGPAIALMSHRVWTRQFEGRSDVIGRSLMLGSTAFTIIGVLPPGSYPLDIDFVSPASVDFQTQGREARYLQAVARLAPGATIESATPEIATINRRLAQQYPATDKDVVTDVVSLQSVETGEARRPLLLLLGAVSVVLLIACVNIASLLLARAAERRHEAAIRMSLGAGRSSLVRLYLLESGWLALGGGLLGLLVAEWGVTLLTRILPADLPRLATAAVNWRVAGFAAITSMGTALLFGLLPALHAAFTAGGHAVLRDGTRTTDGRSRLTTRRLLVALQVALSMALLVSAGLLARSLFQMRSRPLGVRPDQAVTVRINLPWDTDSRVLADFFQRTLVAFVEIPGVRAVALTDRLPLEGESQRQPIRLETPSAAGAEEVGRRQISYRAVSDGFFATLEVPVKAGRVWSRAWTPDAPLEVVVNETFARRYLPADRAIGARLAFDRGKPGTVPRWYEVIGVVGDIRQQPNQPDQPPEIFLRFQETYWPLGTFVLRTTESPERIAAAVRRAVASIDPNQLVGAIEPFEASLRSTTDDTRTRTTLAGLFATASLLLTAIGLYGVLASDVVQRTREIGVRVALGAEPGAIRWMVVRQGVVVAVLGVAVGAGLALVAGRMLAEVLFGIATTDLLAFAASAASLLGIAALASYLPARRASAVDPARALRRE